jgi:fucose 4-O-acetylase-like acetyltransferase
MYNLPLITNLTSKGKAHTDMSSEKLEPVKQNFFSRAFNLPYLKTSRHNWIDYLKGIAIILVVYRHALIGIERTHTHIPEYLVNANMIFYSFRMPLFFVLSGLFISSSFAKRTFVKIASLKFETLIYPYFLWAFLQITFQILFGSFTNATRSFIDYSYIFYQPRELDQFWYLPALFNVTMIYLIIKSKIDPPVWLQIIIGLIFYFLAMYVNKISILSDWMEFYIFFAIGDATSKFFFNKQVQQFLKSTWLLLLIIPFFVVVQIYYLSYSESFFQDNQWGRIQFVGISLFGCISMVVLAFRLQNLNTMAFLRIVGYHSLYIYVMHVFVAALVRIVLMNVFSIYNPLVLVLSGIIVSIILCIMFYNLLIKNNVLWFLFTYRKNEAEVPILKA